MKRINARYLLNFSTEQLWNKLIGRFRLVFDDGEEIETTYRETLYSSYFWDMHRQYPQTPLLAKHHVSHVLRGKSVTSKTHIELLGIIFWDTVENTNMRTPADRDPLVKLIYEITNNLYNGMTHHAEAFVVSIDILDFIEVTEHPTVKGVLDKLTYDDASIALAYSTLLDVLNNAPGLENNALARAVRAKMVSSNQVLQCVGPRGYLTDVDGERLPTPILRSYTNGMRSLYNTIAESRSAAKSLYFSESPLQDAEYFARRLQLLCMVVEKLDYMDCGSTEYLLWRVKPPIENKGKVEYPGDLKFLVGKYYLDETTNTLVEIKAKDTHLYDTTIKIRSVIYCKHPDPHTVCSVCFGKMSDNVMPDANLGHVCSATMTQQTSQSVLSTKHLDASSSTEPIELTEVSRRYFTIGKGGTTYVLKKELKDEHIKMIVSQDEAFGLTDIHLTEKIEDISPGRISKIDYIGFIDPKASEGIVPVCISQNARYAMFTLDFLRYVKTQRWELDNKCNFVFNLDGWDFSKPVFRLPEIEYSFSQHSHQIAEIIESRMKDITDRLKPGSPASTLVELFDLVNAKLNVNLALLEVILYASMIRSGEEDGYGLARNSPTGSLGVANMTIKNRSLGAAMAYEMQTDTILAPSSFYKLDRPDSLFDVFVCPYEVMQAYGEKA